jgi:hypothetical protein
MSPSLFLFLVCPVLFVLSSLPDRAQLLRELDQLRADKKFLLARGPLQPSHLHDDDIDV